MSVGAESRPRLKRLTSRANAPETTARLRRLPRRSHRPLLGLKPEPLLDPRAPVDRPEGPGPSAAEPLSPELDALLLNFLDDGDTFEMEAAERAKGPLDTHAHDADDDEEEDTSEDSRPAFLLTLAPPDQSASDAAKTVVARPPKRREPPRTVKPRAAEPQHPQIGRVLQGESLLETPAPVAEPPQSEEEAKPPNEPDDFDNSAAILLPSSEFGRPPLELLDLDARHGTARWRWVWPLLIAVMVLVGSVGAYLLRTAAG